MANKSTKPAFKLWPLWASLIILLLGAAVWIYAAKDQSPAGSGPGSGKALVGGAFELVDHTGRTVTDQDFRGKYSLVFFGYTFCPDVCPVELQTLSAALDELDPKTLAKVQPLFITIDPERDTVEAMAHYVSLFHPKLIGLTGTPDQIQRAARAYRVYYQKVDDDMSGTYLMDHSAIVFLMDPNGDYLSHFSPGVSAEAMADKLRSLVK